ncbi:MAG: T9SS type A sorting domain-containing protein, partial [Bacteroidota bacterium]
VYAQHNVRIIGDNDLNSGTYTWVKDTIYMLNGFVYLESGGRLNIEAGTVIKAIEVPSTTDLASTLIITRGAQINAVGTADEPIIFTTELDDTNDQIDLFPEDRGLWGGLIILGRGIFIKDGQAEQTIEGLPIEDPRSLYGGNNNADNSGRLSYVSIRHGGAELGPGDEINGLTLGGVGSGTQIDHIEVYSNSDDGIEFFGGAVNVSYAVVSFCGDDAFDWDLGYVGRGQYWFAMVGEDNGDNTAEMDGADPAASRPSSNPIVTNATYIGSGRDAFAKNEHALLFRDGSRGTYLNSIFTQGTNFALQVEDRQSGVDSYQYYQAGELRLAHNIFGNFGRRLLQGTSEATSFISDQLLKDGNVQTDPQLRAVSRRADGRLDPRPRTGSPAYAQTTLADTPDDDFFVTAPFKGAFCEEGVWIQKWTALAQNRILAADIPFSNCLLSDAVHDEFTELQGVILAQNTPNPVNAHTTLAFFLPTAATVTLEIFTSDAKKVTTLHDNKRMIAGDHEITYNTAPLPAGVYYYTLSVDDTQLTRMFIKK